MKSIIKVICILLFYNNLFSQNDNLLNFSEFSKLDHSSKYKYLVDKMYSFNKFNFPEAAYNFIFGDGGSNKNPNYISNNKYIITDLKELLSSNFKKNNIFNTLEAIEEIYARPIFSNKFYYTDEFDEGLNDPFYENYYRFNDSLFLRSMIFFENKEDLIKVNSEYNTTFQLENIFNENKFDLHLVLYHKESLEKRLKFLKKVYSKRKQFKDYKNQIKKINEFLKYLNSKS